LGSARIAPEDFDLRLGRRDSRNAIESPPVKPHEALSGAHLPALIGAAAADGRNIRVTELFAGLCARFANLCAGAASNVVQMRVANHEVVRREANLRAVQQMADVVRVSMLPAFFEAIVDRV
jgi:hypothetical protein